MLHRTCTAPCTGNTPRPKCGQPAPYKTKQDEPRCPIHSDETKERRVLRQMSQTIQVPVK